MCFGQQFNLPDTRMSATACRQRLFPGVGSNYIKLLWSLLAERGGGGGGDAGGGGGGINESPRMENVEKQ